MKNLGKRLLSAVIATAMAAGIFVTSTVTAFAYTETTGTVSTDNVKVRASASTTASQVSSLRNGDVVDIVDESTDASGYVWYKIRVNKSEFGYVRSDLITKAGSSSANAAPATDENKETTENKSTATATATTPAPEVTPTDARPATITEDSVNVRQGAGTGFDSVGKVTKGDSVTVVGEATSSDGKTWYKVTFGSSNKEGFIRSDLLQIGEATAESAEGEGTEVAEGAEGTEEATEQPAEEQTSSGNQVASEAGDGRYALVYTTDEAGAGIWYLYMYESDQKVKVDELIAAAKSSEEVEKINKSNKSYKTVLFILAFIIALLVAGLVFLALKLRESYYYEDEEEEEYDRYSQPQRRRGRDEDDEEEERPRQRRPLEERTVRPERPVRPDRTERPERPERPNADRPVRPSRPVDDGARARAARPDAEDRPVRRRPAPEDEYDRPVRRSQDATSRGEDRSQRSDRRAYDEDERPVRRPSRPVSDDQPREQAPRRKTRNFVGDEDDFEFEFLDLDDEK